ncbi:MAG: FAD/NAD(P)-binding oxidoreductase [Aquificaceae bacterium]
MSKRWSDVSRRSFLVGATALGLTAPLLVYSQPQRRQRAQVVVVGGGYGGVTTAKYIKKENPSLDVVLIEERPFFMSCPMSNHFLSGLMELTSLCFSYNVLEVKYGIRILMDKVLGIELDRKVVRTSTGYIAYDYLVLSPGIDYDIEDAPFYKESLVHNPPAFKPGSEHIYLKRLIEEFEGGDIVITVPPPPYRCPQAPYERVALIASMIKRNKLKAHIYFIDASERPIINSEGFLSAYYELYKDVATYITSAQVRDIDVHKRVVKTSHGDFRYDIANIIPPMKASGLLQEASLVRRGQKWVEVNPLTFESSVRNVFVIGDAAQSYLPKSGYAAHSEGKLVASIINARLRGKEVKEEYLQMICYAMVSDKEAVMTETTFRYDVVSKRFIPTHREDNVRKESTAKRYQEWARGLWRDLFG